LIAKLPNVNTHAAYSWARCGPGRALETVPEVAEAFRFYLRMAELSTSGSNREL
jgi:hypothetical protein